MGSPKATPRQIKNLQVKACGSHIRRSFPAAGVRPIKERTHTLEPMKILVDSDEYRCWHEVGHATVCLHLGGDVEFIEFLTNDPRGHARTRCIDKPGTSRFVACGGFTAECYLLSNGHAEKASGDARVIDHIVLGNAIQDIEDFRKRKLVGDEFFSEAEVNEFMHCAVGTDGRGGLIPIFNQYFSGMQELVRELCEARRVEGRRVKELLRIGLYR